MLAESTFICSYEKPGVNMTIRKKIKWQGKIEIDLTLAGPNGNALYLLARAGSLADQLGLDPEGICQEMKSGDYENLLKVFDKYFGDYVTLYR